MDDHSRRALLGTVAGGMYSHEAVAERPAGRPDTAAEDDR